MDKEKERLRDEEETNDIITAEDLAEQALYAATAPDCCSDAEKAQHMLGMLGANVTDEEVYHDESEHVRRAVIDRVAKEFDAFHSEMTSHLPEAVFYAAHEISVKSELKDTICEQEELSNEEYQALNSEDGNLLDNLYNRFMKTEGASVSSYTDTAAFVENYCRHLRESQEPVKEQVLQ